MAKIITDDAYYKQIANAIREKAESTETYTPSEMADAISGIELGLKLDALENQAAADDILVGHAAYDASGAIITGAAEQGLFLDELDNPATPQMILSGYEAYDSNGNLLSGSGVLSDITVKSGVASFIEVPAGSCLGIGSVTVEGDEDLVPENIKFGANILGVEGSYIPAELTLTAKSLEITQNGTQTVVPGRGYDGISKVTVKVNVPTEITEVVVDAELQSKSVTPGRTSQTVTPDEGYDALSSVSVAGDGNLIGDNIKAGVTIFGVDGSYENEVIVDAVLQAKTVTPGRSAQTITPDSGYDGLSSVYVAGTSELIGSNIREGVTIFGVQGTYSSGQIYQEKTVSPTKAGLTVTSDNGYNALSKVTIKGDPNLVAENIADGTTIFGVTGNYISPMKHLTVVPSVSEQYIIPTAGYYGFSSVTVAPSDITGDYAEGYAAGVASRDEEIASLEARIATLLEEKNAAYYDGYELGYETGAMEVTAGYKDLDEVMF